MRRFLIFLLIMCMSSTAFAQRVGRGQVAPSPGFRTGGSGFRFASDIASPPPVTTYGPNIFSAGSMDSSTGWTTETGTIGNGVLTWGAIGRGGGNYNAYHALDTVISSGSTVRITFIVVLAGANVTYRFFITDDSGIGSSVDTTVSSNGTSSVQLTVSSGAKTRLLFYPLTSTAQGSTIDNIIVEVVQ